MKSWWRKSFCIFVAMTLLMGTWISFPVQQAGAVDEYNTLRLKWFNYLTGADLYAVPVSDPDIQSRIDSITISAQEYWDNMNTDAGRTYLWADVTVEDYPGSRDIYENYTRVYSMALAYRTEGSTLEGDGDLLLDLSAALDWLYDNQYNDAFEWQLSHHMWEISIPTTLCHTVVLLYEVLTPQQITNYMNAVHEFANDPTDYAISTTPSYGANRLWESLVIALRGIIVKDGSRLALVRDRLGDYEAAIYPFVKTLNGWYRDGSFISHDRHPYNGAYGLSHFKTFIELNYLLSDSSWEITDSRGENVFHWARDGYVPLLHKGRIMDMVRGRTIAKQNASDHSQGKVVIHALLALIESSNPEEAALLKSAVKAWVQGDTYEHYLEYAPLWNLIKAKTIVEDQAVVPLQQSVYRQYAGMDRAVQQRPDYAFGISMFSDRIYDFEAIGRIAAGNADNKKAWYTSSGMTYLYNDDLAQYNDNFWATVNMKRLPGTTVDAEHIRPDGDDSKLGTDSWTGGVEIGEYGASGMMLTAYGNTLSAKKSWFAFDDELVALGSDIDSTDNRTIETIIENRKLNAVGDNVLTVDGSVKSSTVEWNESMNDVGWIHLQGNAASADVGYVFPGRAHIKGLRESRTGSWPDINDLEADTTLYSNRFLNLWFDHGANPAGAQYAYVVLPGKNAAQVSQYGANPNITILEQSDEVHAVKENTLNIIAANFWSDVTRTVDIITVDKKASVAVRDTGSELEISVADPTQENQGMIEVEIAASAAKVISADPAIKVLRLEPTIKLAVQTAGSGGLTKKILLHKTDSTLAEVAILSPIADASTHGGQQADTNYGTATSVSVKDAIDANDNRKGYLKFDLTGVNTVTRAKLRLATYTSSGEAATLSVLGGSDSWSETGIVKSNEPQIEAGIMDTIQINGMEQYYDFDVTDYVSAQATDDQTATFIATGADYENVNIAINSREHSILHPQLVIEGTFSGITPVTPSSPEYAEPNQLALDENFNSAAIGTTPAGWTIESIGGQAVVDELQGSLNDRDLKLSVSGSGGFVKATKEFSPRSGLVSVEFKVRTDQMNAPFNVSLQEDALSSDAVTLKFDTAGRIAAANGAASVYLQPYETGVWHKVKMIIDTGSDTYDVYIDEERKARRLALKRSIDEIGVFTASITSSSSGTSFIDDVRVGLIESMEPSSTANDISGLDTIEDIPMPNYVVNDHFNALGTDMPEGWTTVTHGGTVAPDDTPNGTNRSLRISDTSTSYATEAVRDFSPMSGSVIVDYWVMAEQNNVSFGAPYIYDGGTNDTGVIVFSSDGNIKAYNGNTPLSLGTYQANEWYHMSIVLNTDTDKYDVYVNGVMKAQQYSFRKKVSRIGKLKYFFSAAASGAMHVDNVRVLHLKDAFVYPNFTPKPEVTLDAPETASSGETFKVSLSLANPQHNVYAEKAIIRFDSNRFDFDRAEAGGVSGLTYDVASIAQGYLRIEFESSGAITGNANLIDLFFMAKPVNEVTEGDISLLLTDLYLSQEMLSLSSVQDDKTVKVDVGPDYQVNDAFNDPGSSLPTGWTTETDGGTVSIADVPTTENRSLLIEDTSGSHGTKAIRSFTSLSGIVAVEYKVMPGQNNVSFGAPYVFDSSGTKDTGVIIFSSDGNIKAYNGTTAQSLQAYNADEWYEVMLVLDTDTDKYDVYINGVLKAQQYAFRNNASSIDKLQFFFSSTPMGTMHIDDVRVSVN